MKLLIVHSHYRPGGVRRVIELATPHVATALMPAATEVVLVGGEAPPERWTEGLQAALGACRLSVEVEPALGYFSEQEAQPATLRRRIRAHLARVLTGATAETAVVWAHNQGLGRNLLLAEALQEACAERTVPLVFHHHDWWFDNRWARWPEMKRAGFGTLADVAAAMLPARPQVRHATINQADAAVLERRFGGQAGWIPNLASPPVAPSPARIRRTKTWLREQLGDDAPVWLLPCRLLRRKNIAEAFLLTRWLRPGSWLVTTGDVSSADERAYAAALQDAAVHHGWRLRLSILAGDETNKPTVPELLAASEAVLLTSLQEGFGLPNLEAAAAARPLITRSLGNIAPDLERFGFRFPQAYEEISIDTGLFDVAAERARQSKRFLAWRKGLPRSLQTQVAAPALLTGKTPPKAVPFSRLTLPAQLEVLRIPAAQSWEACVGRNPFLERWRALATEGELEVSGWPRTAEKWLGGAAYGRHFTDLLSARSRGVAADAGEQAILDFTREKLGRENHYPLLWSSEP